jgi:hypothetical protein
MGLWALKTGKRRGPFFLSPGDDTEAQAIHHIRNTIQLNSILSTFMVEQRNKRVPSGLRRDRLLVDLSRDLTLLGRL